MRWMIGALMVLGAGGAAAQDAAAATGGIGEKVDPDSYSILSEARGLNTHRPMFVYPATYADEFHGAGGELRLRVGDWRVRFTDQVEERPAEPPATGTIQVRVIEVTRVCHRREAYDDL